MSVALRPTDDGLHAARQILADQLADGHRLVTEVDDRLGPMVDHLLAFAGRGKWLRPRFLLAGYLTTARAPVPEPVLRAAAGLELLQACALLHDDLIDRSDTRRGEPSTHRAAESAHRSADLQGDSARFGEAVAILLGDLALAWADDLVYGATAELGRPEAAEFWRAMRTEVLAGQLLDVRITADPLPDPDRQYRDAMAVNLAKTAAYTVRRPVQLGAALAGAPAETLEVLGAYGDDVGVAFQLRDDLLGLFGDPAVTGKPAGDDLIEGKRTAVLALARKDLAGRDESAAFDRSLSGVIDVPMARELAGKVAQTTAPRQVETEITALLRRAVGLLESGRAVLADDGRSELVRLAWSAGYREA